MGMKRHGASRKPVLSLDSTKDSSPRPTWKSKYEQICASHAINGNEMIDVKGDEEVKATALHGLSGYLSSDSSSDNSEPDPELEKEVEAFLKEVDALKTDLPHEPQPVPNAFHSSGTLVNPPASTETSQPESSLAPMPTVAWQECYDGSTGFTYYWNMETNEVTWEMPQEYRLYKEALKQWQQYQAHGVVAMIQQARAQQQQQLLKMSQQNQPPKPKEGELVFPFRSKKKKKKKSDFEDEKIELITSYGPISGDESSDEEEKIPLSKLPPPKKKSEKKASAVSSQPTASSTHPISIGPQLPPARLKKLYNLKDRLVPKKVNPSSPLPQAEEKHRPDHEKEMKKEVKEEVKERPQLRVADKPQVLPPPRQSSPQAPLPNVESERSNEGVDDTLLLDQLKSKHTELKEVEEAPEMLDSKDGKPPSLVAPSYAHDSDLEDEGKEDEGPSSKSIKSKLIKLKLSARGKALINASVTTAKARVTDFVETPEGLIHIENIEGQLTNTVETSLSNLPTKVGLEAHKRKLAGGLEGGAISADPRHIPTNSEGTKKLRVSAANFYKDRPMDIKSTPSIDSIDEKLKAELDVKDTSEVLLDKMRYLSEVKEPVSPVQVLTIQLQTLVGAWECNFLKEEYLKGWLLRTKLDLEQLESSVVPPGWLCQWQRYGPLIEFVFQCPTVLHLSTLLVPPSPLWFAFNNSLYSPPS